MTAPQVTHTFDMSLLETLTDSPENARRQHGVRFHHFYARQISRLPADMILEAFFEGDEEVINRKGDLVMTVVTCPLAFVGMKDGEGEAPSVAVAGAVVRDTDQGSKYEGRRYALAALLRGDMKVMRLAYARQAITERRLPLLLLTAGNQIKQSVTNNMMTRLSPIMLAPPARHDI